MKVNESTNAANLLMVGMQSNSNKTSDQDSGMDFSSVLSNTKEKSVETVDTIKSAKYDGSESKSAEKAVNSTSKRDDMKIEDKSSTVKTNISEKTENHTEKMEVSSNENEVVEDVIDDPETISKVSEVLSSLINELSQILDISVEELTYKLESMDMVTLDLLSVEDMKQLLLDMNGAVPMDLLTNEDLNANLQEITQAIDEALNQIAELGVDVTKLPEDISFEDLMVNIQEEISLEDNTISEEQKGVLPDVKAEVEDFSVAEEPVVIVEDNRKDSSESSNKEFNNQQETSTTTSDIVEKDDVITQTSKKETPKFENQILQNIQNSLEGITDIDAVAQEGTVSPAQVLDQIVEQVKVQMNQDNTSLQMQLYPEHLGKIQINVVSKDGVMTASIVAENEAAKQAIEGGLASLKEAMENQNIKVEAIEVMVSTTGFEQSNEKNEYSEDSPKSKSNKKIDLSELDEDDLDMEEAAEVEKMKATGSSVSYSI